MKKLFNHQFVFALVAASLALSAHAESPGLVDFGKFTPPGKGGEFVEVHLKNNLLAFAAQLVEKDEPDAGKLLRSVQLIQVYVVGISEENRAELQKRIQNIRQNLESHGWDRNVNVQGKAGEDVGVYTQAREGQTLAGVAVTVVDANHLVLVNIVGDIKPEQIAALGERLNIKPLKEIGEANKK